MNGEVISKLIGARRVAVVGLSDDPSKASHEVAAYLQSVGTVVVPVNPTLAGREVLGERAYASLAEVPGEIDLVDVFRRAEFCPDVAREAVARGVGGIWLQLGIRSPEARKIAEDAGVAYVEDRCLLVEHSRRSG